MSARWAALRYALRRTVWMTWHFPDRWPWWRLTRFYRKERAYQQWQARWGAPGSKQYQESEHE